MELIHRFAELSQKRENIRDDSDERRFAGVPGMKFRKVLLWLTASLVALTILALVVVSVLPRLINTETVKRIVEARIAEKLGAHISYRSANSFLLPRPGVIFHNGTITYRDRVRGSFDSLDVRLNGLPLLRGSLRVSSLRLTAPNVSVRLERREEKKMPTLAEVRATLIPLFKTLAEKVPNLDIAIEKGTLTIHEEKRPVLLFSDLDANIVFPPRGPKIRITGSSNFADAMKILLQMDQESLSGKGEIDLRQLRMKPIFAYGAPHGPVKVEGSGTDLNLSLTTAGMKTVEGEVFSSLSPLTLVRKGKKLAIRGKTLRGDFRIRDDRLEVSLRELELSDPRLTLTGTLLVDRTDGQISMKIEGRGIDVRPLREAAYSFAGDVPIVQSIFSYVREGAIPRVTVSSQARSFGELGNTENIRVSGRIEKGEVFVEGPHLDFRNVSGSCDIINGMLDGTGIDAVLEGSRLQDGKLRVGLEGAVVPLRLDTRVAVDLTMLQPLLSRLLKNKAVVHEISLMKGVRGKARGRLIMTGNSASPDVVADVQDVNLSADYLRVPYPVRIIQGGVFYDGKKVATKNLRGAVGGSSFSGLAASLELKKGFLLDISSGSLTVSLPEIYHWLGSYETLKPVFRRIGSPQGTLSLSSLQVKGPLRSPEEWRFRIEGRGRDLAFTSSSLPGPVAVARTSIEATEEKVAVSGAEVRMLDSAVDLAGEISGYMKGARKIDLTLKGSVGPESFRRISDTLKFPVWIRNSLQLSVASSHLVWERNGATAFSGVMTVAKGPAVSLDVVSDKKGLRLNRLLLEDSSSRAEISLSLNDRKIDLGFSGKLTGKTAEALIAAEEQPGGWISGDLRAEVMSGRPVRFTAQGKMQGDGFVFPVGDTPPLEIDHLSAEADGKRLRLDSCDLKWGSDEVLLSGNLTFLEKGIAVDMDASTEVIDAASIAKKLKKIRKKSEKKVESAAAPAWASGSVRVRAGRLGYNKISLAPFSADISLTAQGLGVGVTEADFCGISLPGRMSIGHGEISLEFRPVAKDGSLESTLTCLSHSFDINEYATGTFDLAGKITGKGGEKDILRRIDGDIDFTARDGRIYQEPSLLKILAFLEVTEIVRGYGDVWRKGLAYDKVVMKDTLRHDRLEINEGTMDGPSMKMASQGYIDLNTKKLDVRFLVSPLRTVDRIIEHIPLIGHLLGYTLLSVPVRVTGDLKDPQVNPFSLSSADSGLLGLMKNTLTLPFKLFAPLFKGKQEGEKKDGAVQGESH
jgi:hypothetical protein